MKKETHTEELRCELTPAEVAARADEAARIDAELDVIAAELREAKSREKALREPKEDRQKLLLREVREKATTRQVECKELLRDSPADGLMVDTVRFDTGEIVRSRPATDQDRQGRLAVLPNEPVDEKAEHGQGSAGE